MTLLEALKQHQQTCDELHRLVLEENRFLQQQRRVPDAPLLERKRLLSEQLDATLQTLRGSARGEARQPEAKAALDQTRSRILQILQVEKENEQLLLRYSLSGTTTAPGAPAISPGLLQKIYAKNT